MVEVLEIDGTRLYTIRGAASEWGVSPVRARDIVRARNIGRRLGNQVVLTQQEVDAHRDRTPGRPRYTDD